jgi:hypothetical protein
MAWTTPRFDELKMDAEIGSYQEDREPGHESPLSVEPDAACDRQYPVVTH